MRTQSLHTFQKSQNINIDLQYLKQLARPEAQLANIKQRSVGNMNNLARLLKMKNSKFSFSQHTKQTGQDWIRRKGADVSPLIEKVSIIKKNIQVMEQEKRIQTECHFYIPQLTYENQGIYIQKNFQFGILRTVQSVMSIPEDRGNLAKRTIYRRKIDKSNNPQLRFTTLPAHNLQTRNPIKKTSYINATKQILNFQDKKQQILWAKFYREATKQKFWQIITNQLSYLYEHPNRNNPISKLSIASLKMVENILKQELPLDYSGILHYLTNNYLGQINRQFNSDGRMGPVWGISFLLYRAGRKDQFYQTIQDQQLKKSFQQADVSIKNGQPKKIQIIQEGNDVFKNQLIYALKGVTKTEKTLCNQQTIDCVWVLLRNLGIFPDNSNMFQNCRRDLFQKYKAKSMITTSTIQNLLYLLGYIEVAQIGTNQMMDQDDYLHYLISLYHSQIYEFIQKDKKQIIEKKLTEKLVYYIQQLLLQKKLDYIYYIVVMPQSRIPQQISSIIVSSNLLQSLNWKYLSKMLPKRVFEKLVHASTQKYAAFHQNYIQVAKKLCELLDDGKIALDFMLSMIIKSFLLKKVYYDELASVEQFVDKILWKDQNLKAQYAPVFGFFSQYRQLMNLIGQRNQYRIYDFLEKSTHILISEQLKIQTRIALQKLIQFGGFQCYIHYLKGVVTALQISLIRMKKNEDLRQIQGLILTALLVLIRTQPYIKFANKQIVKVLINILENAVCVDKVI